MGRSSGRFCPNMRWCGQYSAVSTTYRRHAPNIPLNLAHLESFGFLHVQYWQERTCYDSPLDNSMLNFYLGITMVRCHLSRMMGERKMKIVDVARETGLHRNSITLLYNETANRIDLETIDSLCELFHCSVGDLFEYCPSNTSRE